ncbi:MAG TPA: ABC transporter substrate-binding protein [Pseudolabrys sp.]|nr:ABC transporter substrate-binding protein [Pseudolabrys sp.]
MIKSTMTRILAAALALSLLAFTGDTASAQDKTSVTIRFSWKMKGEFAPLYVALDKGYFSDEKLDVKLGEGTSSQTALGSIVQGQDQAAWIPGVYAAQAISKGMQVKIVGLYNKAAPNVLLSRADKPITKVQDLVGAKVGHSIGDVGTTFIKVLCKKNNLDCNSFSIATLAAQARVASLVGGKVDVISVYTSNDVPILEDKFGANAFAQLDLPKFGLRVMGASLIVSDAYLKQNPKIVTAMLRAINRGFQDTIADPRAAAQVMLKHWNTPLSLDIVTKQVQALNKAVEQTPGKPINWVDPVAVEDTLDALLTAGEITSRKPIGDYINNDLVPGA